MSSRIVIIGGVACGPKAAARARRRDSEARITIIERRSYVSYASCGLPYYVGGVTPELEALLTTTYGQVRDPDYFAGVKDIQALTGVEAVAIDRAEKTVRVRRLDSGEESSIPYDKLALATGARPKKPDCPGVDLDQVWTLWSLEDARIMRERIEAGAADRVCVIGAGLIGLESCEALVNQAVEVTLIELMPQVLPGLLDPEMAALVEAALRDQKISLRLGEGLESISGENGKVVRVKTGSGEIETDAVILAMGAAPNIELARAAGLELGECGAIKVDDHLRTSDPEIFAGGDCVENRHLITGRAAWHPLGSIANLHGRVIGDNLTGNDAVFPGVLGTGIMRTLGVNVGFSGLTESAARKLGYQVVTAINAAHDKSHVYPGGKDLNIKLVADEKSRKLLGGQVVGAGEAARVVDAVAASLRLGATIDQLADLDFCYAPPFGTPITPLAATAAIAQNKAAGIARTISPLELGELLESKEDFTLLDIRFPAELEARPPINDPRLALLPINELRARIGELRPDRKTIVVCQTGVRSYEGQRTLSNAGFKDARFLEGGMKLFLAAKAKQGRE